MYAFMEKTLSMKKGTKISYDWGSRWDGHRDLNLETNNNAFKLHWTASEQVIHL